MAYKLLNLTAYRPSSWNRLGSSAYLAYKLLDLTAYRPSSLNQLGSFAARPCRIAYKHLPSRPLPLCSSPMAILKMDDLEVAPLSRWVSALLPRSESATPSAQLIPVLDSSVIERRALQVRFASCFTCKQGSTSICKQVLLKSVKVVERACASCFTFKQASVL